MTFEEACVTKRSQLPEDEQFDATVDSVRRLTRQFGIKHFSSLLRHYTCISTIRCANV